MTDKKVINYNGNIFPANQPVFTSQNRAFRYGDGLFESIRIISEKIPLLPLHYQRLVQGLKSLKIVLPDNFTEDFCRNELTGFAEEAGISQNGRLRLSFFRKDGGLYAPVNNLGEYVLEGTEAKNENFNLNEKGLLIDIYHEAEKHFNPLSAYKTSNALMYVMAALYRDEHKLDDCLLINSRSRVIESINSNLFLVKGNELFTPPLGEGCVAGVMREFILYLADKHKITKHELPLTLEEIFEADEAFLTNAIYGVRWVEKYKSKTFTNQMAEKLSRLLNEALIEK